jgi:ParB family chromosome partitioning protein
MAERVRGLGRGLESLIPTPAPEPQVDVTAKTDANGNRVSGDVVAEIPPHLLDPNPYQPRKDFNADELEALAASIRVHGILQPLVVSKVGNRYQLIAGERRLRAAKIAGLDVVPAIVRTFDEQQKLELAIIENIQRSELNVIELATAYKKLNDEFNISVGDIAKKVSREPSTISNVIRLLNLIPDAQQALIDGKIAEGHGRAILSVVELDKQAHLLNMILTKHWSSYQANEYARGYKGELGSKLRAQARLQTVSRLTKDLGDYLGAKVMQLKTAKGGKLIIEYYSEEELERIAKVIQGDDEN